jgi:Na+/H+ antiporter NhaA
MSTPIVYEGPYKQNNRNKKTPLGLIIGTVTGGLLILTGAILGIVIPLMMKKKKASSSSNQLDTSSFTIDEGNNIFKFYRQDDGVHVATVDLGEYTGTELALAVETALNATVGVWTVTWAASTSKFTINTETFMWDRCDDETSIYSTMGFAATDNGCGTEWKNTEVGEAI